MTSILEFSEYESQKLNELASGLLGFDCSNQTQRQLMFQNVKRRLREREVNSISDYLDSIKTDQVEARHLISAMTIHYTGWFREMIHYDRLDEFVRNNIKMWRNRKFKVLCGAVSTGQEAYTTAIVLEKIRRELRHTSTPFDYEIESWDVDWLSLQEARKAIYPVEQLTQIPAQFRGFLDMGVGKAAGLFTLNEEIRERCEFRTKNLVYLSAIDLREKFDWLACRNVLIYFKPERITEVIGYLKTMLDFKGRLVVGASEVHHVPLTEFKSEGSGIFSKIGSSLQKEPMHTDLILIGASTGGPEALVAMLKAMPKQSPPILVVQHISHDLAKAFGERLAQESELKLGAGADMTLLEPGHIYMALGDYHIKIEQQADGRYRLRHSNEPPFQSSRPSVHHLFQSANKFANRLIAVILTGMGQDGAEAIAKLRGNGALCLVQDEASSVVFGMPKAAIAARGADMVGDPTEIRCVLDHWILRGY